MSGEEWTKGTIWLALICFAWSEWPSLRRETARRLSTLGLVLFLAHVALAFGCFYRWSPAIAYRETAAQTGARLGVAWGGGLYFNYLFACWWMGEELWKWSAPEGWRRRSPRWLHAWRGFFWLMAFNGTVVFGSGAARWLGAVLCGGLAAIWWRGRRNFATLA